MLMSQHTLALLAILQGPLTVSIPLTKLDFKVFVALLPPIIWKHTIQVVILPIQ